MHGIQLDQYQQAAANFRSGWAVVTAAAGSGKSTALTFRSAALIREGVDPARICILVYNTDAAKSLRGKLRALVGPRGARVQAVTFHRFGLNLIRATRGGRMPKLVGKDKDAKGNHVSFGSLMGPTLRRVKTGLTLKEMETQTAAIRERLWDLTDKDTATKIVKAFGGSRAKKMIEAIQQYQQIKETMGFIDFADMIGAPGTGLLKREQAWLDVLPSYDHVMVDEGQDMNEGRFMIAATLAQTAKSFMIVGDLRQAICSYCGAEPDMFNRLAHTPGVTMLRFPVNRRSTTSIVQAANGIAEGEDWNLGGACDARPEAVRGEPVQLWATENPAQEVDAIAENIKRRVAIGLPLAQPDGSSSYAVLARTRAWLLVLQAGLLRRGFPVRVLGGGSGLFASPPGRQFKAYLAAADGEAEFSLLDVINEPKRYCRKWDAIQAIKLARREQRTIAGAIDEYARTGEFQKPMYRSALRHVSRDIISLTRKKKWAERCAKIEELLLRNHIDNEDEEASIEAQDLVEIIRLIARLATELGSRQRIAEYEVYEQQQAKQAGAVELGSVHISKGQEWPVVYVAGVNNKKFPHNKAHSLDEERRLFYVGVTRAQEVCIVSSGGEPSDFFQLLE